MRWKTVRSTEYLFRDKDRRGNGKSLGPRSPETEAEAGSHFLLELLASGDVDLLYDARKKMTVVSEKLDGEGLLGLLKKVDETFECVRENGYRAANAGQFMLDLVIAPRGMQDSGDITFSREDLVAAEVPGLQWLLNAPNAAAVDLIAPAGPV